MAISGAAGPQPTTVNMTVDVLAGDVIGPEVMAEALNVLRRISELYGHSFTFAEANVGGAAWAAAEAAGETPSHLPPASFKAGLYLRGRAFPGVCGTHGCDTLGPQRPGWRFRPRVCAVGARITTPSRQEFLPHGMLRAWCPAHGACKSVADVAAARRRVCAVGGPHNNP